MNIEKEKRAMKVLQGMIPSDTTAICTYSGGKDSDAIKILCGLSGIKYEAIHNLTTVDAPETVQYVKSQPDVKILRPELTMWQLIEKKKFPPTRLVRYCCSELKEKANKGRIKITGVRWAESQSRKNNQGLVTIIGSPKQTQALLEEYDANFQSTDKGGVVLNTDNDNNRRAVELCYRTTSTLINPIIDWTDQDVWEFLHHYGCKSNPLYECGYSRIGCIGCPMAGPEKQKAEFKQYPKYRDNYIKAFDRMLKARERDNMNTYEFWQSGTDVVRWWVGDNPQYADRNYI